MPQYLLGSLRIMCDLKMTLSPSSWHIPYRIPRTAPPEKHPHIQKLHTINCIMKIAAAFLLGLGAAQAITLTPDNYDEASAGKL